MKTDPSEPVYPSPTHHQCPGLTKQEYFAIQCLQGLLSNPSCEPEHAAVDSVHLADMLIEELNKADSVAD